MERIILDAEAGQVSAELARRGTVVAGKIGDAPGDRLTSQDKTFFAVFGFGQP